MAAVLIALAVPNAAAPQFGNLVVDTTADGNDGECNNDCTLREAIALGDSSTGQWVSIRPGVYRLTLGPITLGNDIVFGVSFTGSSSSGARTTVIDARGAGRAFDVPSGVSAVLAGVTVTGGGASVANGGQLNLYGAILRGNATAGRGGAVLNGGSLAVFNSTLTGNSAGAGGAIANEPGANAAVYTSTISGNSGGGITTAGSLQMQRATIAGNTGGGLVQESVDGANTAMWSSLLSGNAGGDCAGSVAGIPRSLTVRNIDSDGSCLWASPDQGSTGDARLGALANNGGATDTHAILTGSPAINNGDPNFCGGGNDQREAPAVGNCDIGSYEFGGRVPVVQLPPPVPGETVNVNLSRGIVKVKLPGSDEFFDLKDAQQVPMGTTFDTSKGRVNLVAAGSQKSWFYQGVFKIAQTRGAKPQTTLTLTGKLSCGRGSGASAAQKKNKKRRLWGDGKGKFRTKGKHSAATVVGTRWLVEDRCNGTLTRVTRGKVRVRAGKKTIVLRAGQKYFARAK